MDSSCYSGSLYLRCNIELGWGGIKIYPKVHIVLFEMFFKNIYWFWTGLNIFCECIVDCLELIFILLFNWLEFCQVTKKYVRCISHLISRKSWMNVLFCYKESYFSIFLIFSLYNILSLINQIWNIYKICEIFRNFFRQLWTTVPDLKKFIRNFRKIVVLKDTLKAFDNFKNKQKSVWSNVICYVKVCILWKCI